MIDLNKISSAKKAPTTKNGGVMSFLNKDISLGSKQLNDKKKEGFYNELTLLLDAGVDIKSSLELIESEQVKKQDKE